MKPIIAITAGDINGVGYEVILKTLFSQHILEICCPVIYGNAKVAREHLRTLDEELHGMQFNIIAQVKETKQDRINIINCYSDDTPLRLGESTPEAGKASFAALERASADLKAGLVHALVTAPINKENIQSDRFHFSGHTEYLTHIFSEGKSSLMMMVSETMRVALVCNHTPIAKVAQSITKEAILSKLTVLNESLQRDFRVRHPRIAVLALNPHAGDNGLIGEEEQHIIRPAIAEAVARQIDAFGPYSADGFFGSGKFAHFDAVLAMYHDQGLAPFKALDMSGVNYTAGLPVIRTSPDHGTAYDLAGKNVADATSFAHALYMAIDIIAARQWWSEINKNPLVVEQHDNRERQERPRFTLDFLKDNPSEDKKM